MKQCEKCGSYVDDQLEKCPFCGNILKTPTTPNKIPTNSQTKSVIRKEKQESNHQPNLSTSVIDNSDQEIANEKSIEVFHSPDLISYQIDEKPQEILEPRTLPKIPIRNFFLWLGLGLVSFGIFYLVYLYLNIEDLEKHSKYPNEPKAEDIDISATKILMLFLVSICFGFIPILWWIFYKKYAGFYNHIKNQSRENAPHKIPHPAYYMTLVIISNLLALVPAILTFFEINLRVSYPGIFWLISSVLIALSIGIIILDYFWQRAFNSHSKITMKKHNILSVEQTTLNNGA